MDKGKMVEGVFTEDMIVAGREFIVELERQKVAVDGAMWVYNPEAELWKLVLFEVKRKKGNPREEYRQIQKVLSGLQWQNLALRLEDISFLPSDSPLSNLWRSAVRTGGGINGIRFKKNVINGVMIEDAYIYFMR